MSPGLIYCHEIPDLSIDQKSRPNRTSVTGYVAGIILVFRIEGKVTLSKLETETIDIEEQGDTSFCWLFAVTRSTVKSMWKKLGKFINSIKSMPPAGPPPIPAQAPRTKVCKIRVFFMISSA